jgi:hypothetical protein
MSLGKLVRVDLRTVWINEATDFTPWLAKPENLEALSETLAMDLESVGTEQNVGNYRADMLCKDAFTDSYVLVENQLEKTNHSHLGQILTYCAGLNVKTVIWIASSFTDEHRAALDYLNEITEEGYSFFGLELELWRIGNSEPAPKFNVISRPNNWTKNVRESAQHLGELSDVKQQQLAYWAGLKEFMDNRRKLKCQNPSPHHWFNLSIGRSGFWLCARVNSLKSRISVDFHMKTPHNKDVYKVFEVDRAAIENEFGGELDWFELPEKKVSYVSVSLESADFRQQDDWLRQFDWIATNLEKLDKVFRKRVKQLQL